MKSQIVNRGVSLNIEIKTESNNNFLFNVEFEKLLTDNKINSFDDLWNLKGEDVKKKLAERGTERVFLDSDNGKVETYMKRYLPLPIKEYLKAITSFRPFFPSGALHEWDAIIAFHQQDIPTMLPIAAGRNTEGKSILITLAITDYTRASDLLANWRNEPSKRAERKTLIANIATLAGKMHSKRFAHQDFYLVHLFVKDNLQVMPIDLQRIIMPGQFKRRWRVKDLGQLLYSALELTSMTDRLLFWKKYTEIVGEQFYRDKALIKSIIRKAAMINNRSQKKKKKKNE